MLYIESNTQEVMEKINAINGKMTQGNLTENEIIYCLKAVKEKALKLVSENQFIGSCVSIRSRFGVFPARYKYTIKGVIAQFKYTKKGWAYIFCGRTEDYPKEQLPRYTIIWSKKAGEKLQKEAEKTYEQMRQDARKIDFYY